MDRLSDLPPRNDTVKTPEEAEVMNNLFPSTQEMMQQQPQELYMEPSSRPSRKINWKMIAASATLFLALANPWIDQIFEKIPYVGENPMSLLGIKALIFVLVMAILAFFM